MRATAGLASTPALAQHFPGHWLRCGGLDCQESLSKSTRPLCCCNHGRRSRLGQLFLGMKQIQRVLSVTASKRMNKGCLVSGESWLITCFCTHKRAREHTQTHTYNNTQKVYCKYFIYMFRVIPGTSGRVWKSRINFNVRKSTVDDYLFCACALLL